MIKKILCAVLILLLIFHNGNIYSSAKEPSDLAAESLLDTESEMTKEDLNIVFAVDHSGSMNEQDAGQMIPKVLQVFTDTMHGENIRVGYLAYNDTIVTQRAPVAVDQEDQRLTLKQTIADAKNGGETDIGLGLREAYHLMDGCSGKKMVVLISDGETDLARSETGRTEEDSEQDIEEIVQRCQAEGTPVVTVAFGEEYEGEEAVLRKISDRTGGESYKADRPEELISILYDLFHTDFSYSVREITDSVYDGGSQRINCGTDGMSCDEMTVLFFSDQEIQEAGVISGGNRILSERKDNYAVVKLMETPDDLAIEFETKQKQRMAVFLVGRRNITPVVEWGGDIYKNKETRFAIHFADENGRQLDSYKSFQWTSEFRSMTDDTSVPVELETTENGLLGKVTFTGSGKYSLYLAAGVNTENTYEVSQINVLNTLPVSMKNDRIEMLTSSGEQMIDLRDYFADDDGDILRFELQELPQDVVAVSIEGQYLHITPKGRGTGDVVLLVSDGEGSLIGRITVQARSWMEVYPAVPFLVVCLLVFAGFKIYCRKKTVITVSETVEEKNRCYFTGKINVYFTLLPNGAEEVPPLTFTLHPIREGKIAVGDMLKNYAELSSLLELDHMFLYPTENRKIIFYHNSRAAVMIGNSIVCRRMQYALSYGNVIYVTSQDGTCEMEMHYVSTN